MGCIVELPEGSHYYTNAAKYSTYNMPNSTETSLKPSGTKSFRVIRLKLNVCHLERSQQGERWKGHHSWCETWWWIADVLGCVSYKGTGYFIRIDGNRNAVSYQKRNFFLNWVNFAFISLEAANVTYLDISTWQWGKTEGQVGLSLATAE